MTLIEVKKDGRVVGRCDARCYLAPGVSERCNCVCEGLNHGRGLEQALDNVPRIADEWTDFEGYQVKTAQVQLKLFRD